MSKNILFQTSDDDASSDILLKLILEQQDTIMDKLNDLDQKFMEHMKAEEEIVGKLISAFPKKPDGSPDFDGHNQAHCAEIELKRDRAEMYREFKKTLIGKGTAGLLIVLVGLITYWWNGHIQHLHK